MTPANNQIKHPNTNFQSKKILNVSNLSFSYNKKDWILKDINFAIYSGEMVAIIGRSGAGKSTLMQTLNGTLKINSGKICDLSGKIAQDVSNLRGKKLRKWRMQCAMIFQDFCLVPRLDVLTNVLLGKLGSMPLLRSLFKIFKKEDQDKAINLLDWLQLLPYAMQRAEHLSGGQQQRVAICRALMQDPKLLLADEPVASLDPKNTERIMQSLKQITNNNISVIINLHSIELVKQYCDRVIGIHDGLVVFDGPVEQLTNEVLKSIYDDELEQIVAS